MNVNTTQKLNELRNHASIGERLLIDEVVTIMQGEPQEDLTEEKRKVAERAKRFVGATVKELVNMREMAILGGPEGVRAACQSWVKRFENALDQP